VNYYTFCLNFTTVKLLRHLFWSALFNSKISPFYLISKRIGVL
jgi:hypothetical protein